MCMCGKQSIFRGTAQTPRAPTKHPTLHTFKCYQLHHRESRKGERERERGRKTERERERRQHEGKGEKGGASSGGVILETNQRLIHSWGLVGPELFLLGCLLAGSCSEECTGACLWKAEAMTSSSLTVAQSGNCSSQKKRGMEQECRKEPITLFSSVLSCASFLSLCRSLSISSPPFTLSLLFSISLLPSLSIALFTSPLHFIPVRFKFSIKPKEKAQDSRDAGFTQSSRCQ